MATPAPFTIKVPCSSANLGPGFDVIGMALSIWLELQVSFNGPENAPLNCTITYEGEGKDEVPLDTDSNLITRTALYVLKCHDQRTFPPRTKVHMINPIPLGRGLGSSGAAVVAGVILGNEAGGLGLTKARLLDYCLMIERHPDNVAAALYGGFVGTYLNELDPKDLERKEIPLSEVLPEPAGGVDTGLKPPEPPLNIGHYEKFPLAEELKFIAIIPDFNVSTADARSVLPSEYKRKDVVFNLQRIPLLLRALEQSPPNPKTIYQAMQDKIHQPYRAELVPGLTQILQTLDYNTHPGLCGICLSGAGPTILAVVTENEKAIAQAILDIFSKQSKPISCQYRVLSPAREGAIIQR